MLFLFGAHCHRYKVLKGYQGKAGTCPARRAALLLLAQRQQLQYKAVEPVINKIHHHLLEEVLSGLIILNNLFPHLSGRQQGLGPAT